jgi:G3E family GTPase
LISLGSGKTTLLNYILSKNHGKKICVIENEFGEVGVDDALVKNSVISTDEMVFEMNNGCICCTVRGDLIEVFKKLINKQAKLDMVIIETTGLADPAPVCQTFFVDENVAKYAELDAVITVVDAKHIIQHLDETKPEGVENEAVEQVAFADRILLNKCDLLEEEALVQVEQRLKSMNPCEVIRTKLNAEEIDLNLILGIGSFDLERVLQMDAEFLDDGKEHKHDQTVSSVGFNFEGEMNIQKLQNWITTLLQVKGTDLYRYKGVLAVKGMEQKYVFQGVHMLFGGTFGSRWEKGEPRMNRFCFIGKNLDKDMIKNNFLECVVTEELRFGVGHKVRCNVEEGWTEGVVKKIWDEGNPYRVTLKTGVDCWAPEDSDYFIRKCE